MPYFQSVSPSGVEDRDHGGPKNRRAVIEHVDHGQGDTGCCQVAAVRGGEHIAWGEWVCGLSIGLPERECDQEDEANDKGCNNMSVAGGVDVRPDDAH